MKSLKKSKFFILFLLCVFRFYRNYDVSIGGLPTHSSKNTNLAPSIPYYQDDFTWCIQKAKFFPLYVNYFFITEYKVWCILVALLIILGTLFYVMIQFDTMYPQRNNRDWVYTTLFVVLSAYLGMSPRFQPVYRPARLLYGMVLFLAVLVVALVGFYLTNFMKVPIPYRQIKTVSEILERDFRLIGSAEVLNEMKHNAMV